MFINIPEYFDKASADVEIIQLDGGAHVIPYLGATLNPILGQEEILKTSWTIATKESQS